ncbi:MAG: hypothetical protein M3552_09575 [Planctomycetota bacterium]|nr:hypothetical protein [Planctomycetaceae bacterium]MDQ3330889.1 hypothetical protein [Planctomycetota bacterium]
MHTLGKVFLGINVILVVAALLLTSKLVNTRNYWMQQVGLREKTIEQNDVQIAEKTKQLQQLQANLVQQRLSWDTMFLAPNSRPDAQGNITVGVGPDQGFGIPPEGSPPPIVHVFVPSGENSSVYVGPFQVTAARGPQTQLAPMFRVFEGEPTTWTPGTWRLWQIVPSQAPSRVVELTNDIVKKREAVTSRQNTLALQQKAVEQAQEHLASHQQELLGNPQATEIAEVPEVRAGLVAALRDAEASRNASLAELDRLRREVDQAYDRLTRLVAQNGRLVQDEAAATPELSSAR